MKLYKIWAKIKGGERLRLLYLNMEAVEAIRPVPVNDPNSVGGKKHFLFIDFSSGSDSITLVDITAEEFWEKLTFYKEL